MFKVTDQPISIDEVVREVVDDPYGGIVTFIGVVRDNSQGKKVLYLEYEAYNEMAEKKMKEIGDEVCQMWGDVKIAMAHRVGHLEIGEASIVIAVATPHRKEAFEACRYAIDRVKQTVPIWKKEFWEGGEMWVGWQYEG
ncbi:MAG: molybdenum cofactor biosynthesis protein MoaE [Candidatus Tectomicrobia bacterium]|nr:molybdenum cofactor biosynthesis protein MoaE [Candidatus Tectomicrobia bacterium]